MTEERLHEIDQHIADGGGDCNGTTERALEDLVAEVRRLRDERDALRKELAKFPTLDGALLIPCNALEAQP
jgi:hypothetical protein